MSDTFSEYSQTSVI